MPSGDPPGVMTNAASPPPRLPESLEPWWTPERDELNSWFENVAPHLAPLYRAAVRMTEDEEFPGRVHFIAHATREIRNRLPDALDGTLKLPRLDYRPWVERICEQWVEQGFLLDGTDASLNEAATPGSDDATVEVSVELVAAVGRLVTKHHEVEITKDALLVPRFEALAGEGPHPPYVFDRWRRASRSAEKFAHARDRELPPEADSEWTQNFRDFEGFLRAISQRAQENIEELDELLKAANSQ